MGPFLESTPSLADIYAAARFLQHIYFLFVALRAVATNPNSPALYLLTACALNAVLVVRPSGRSFRVPSLRTAYSLVSWTGHSLETAYNMQWILHRTNMATCFIILALPLALYVFLLQEGPLRSTSWTSLLLGGNWISVIVWYTVSISIDLYRLGILSSIFHLALVLAFFLVPIALYHSMCAFQTRIAARRIRRARGPDGNTWNPAACLPAEVQLHVFHLLRTRGRFGAREHMPREIGVRRSSPFSGTLDLAAAARTCAAWNAAATEALYRDAMLRSDRDVYALSRTLGARPALALLVRRIALPEWARYAPDGTADAAWDALSSAIDDIISRCTHATDIRLFRDVTATFADIPGLRSAAQHVSHLAIHGFPWMPLRGHEDVDLFLLLGRLPRVQSLSLTGQKVLVNPTALSHSQRSAMSRVRALSLGACTLDLQELICILQRLPHLRTVELRNLHLSDSRGTVSARDLFRPQHLTLAALSLLVEASARERRPDITLGSSFGAFVALRSLTINAHALAQLGTLPETLEELVLSFAPYSCSPRQRVGCQWRKCLFSAVHDVAVRAPAAPRLRAVQLWDDVELAQLAHWSVAAFMLRAMLARDGIAVAVNLLCVRAVPSAITYFVYI